ncbi:MAG: hypothetical protein CEO19_435, partial [Parcubacteria group bacterium Gr01-1014_73]
PLGTRPLLALRSKKGMLVLWLSSLKGEYMSTRLKKQIDRLRQILKGKVRKELKKHISHGELIGKKGKDLVSIPVPQINLPRFRFGHKGRGGAGQGEGEPGTPLGPGQGDSGAGAGNQPGDHIIEVEITLEELAQMLGEELELPRLEPKSRKNLEAFKDRYTSVRRVGPKSLRINKRMMTSALRRFVCSLPPSVIKNPREFDRYLKAALTPSWNKSKTLPVPPFYIMPEDEWYRSWKTYWEKKSEAVIVYMMDVSGSMTEDQKAIVRTTSFWINVWVDAEYKGVDHRYIVHDAEAAEVDKETFYHTRESGGTRISSAYKLFNEMTSGADKYQSKFGPGYSTADTNIYGFHFSDGDNWGEDNAVCLELLDKEILPKCQLFAYAQVEGAYGTGDFFGRVGGLAAKHPNLAVVKIEDKDGIYDALRAILKKEKRGGE